MIRAVAIALAVMGMGCEAVPEITYVDPDAGNNTCPSNVPAYADICCKNVACKGTNCTAACDDCVATCTAPDLCCPNSQGHAVCRPSLQCP